jgi:hypothetical protein
MGFWSRLFGRKKKAARDAQTVSDAEKTPKEEAAAQEAPAEKKTEEPAKVAEKEPEQAPEAKAEEAPAKAEEAPAKEPEKAPEPAKEAEKPQEATPAKEEEKPAEEAPAKEEPAKAEEPKKAPAGPKKDISYFPVEGREKANEEELAAYQQEVRGKLPPTDEDRFRAILRYKKEADWKERAVKLGDLRSYHMQVLYQVGIGGQAPDGYFDDAAVGLQGGESAELAKELERQGYIRTDTTEELIMRLKLKQMQKACSDLGEKPEKTKRGCLKIIMGKADMTFIGNLTKGLKPNYYLDDRGKEQLEKYPAVTEFYDESCGYGIDVNQAYMLKELDPSRTIYSLAVELYERNILRAWAEEDYLECGNLSTDLALLCLHAGGDSGSACSSLAHAYSSFAAIKQIEKPMDCIAEALKEVYNLSALDADDIAARMAEESEYSGYPVRINKDEIAPQVNIAVGA